MADRSKTTVLPKRIGRYDILKLLGKGGQGIVMLARDEELERPVAIKLLKRDADRPAEKLVSEARIVSRLQHPNIVTLYDVGSYHDLPYLVFEYIEGQSLEARIKEAGKLELAEYVILVSQLLAGVAYLHENGIVHRDLGPANVLLTTDGTPKVMDFGISVLSQSEPTGDGYAGTLRYMAPEPFLHQAPGPAADVFTLATLSYEMLTGQRLFSGTKPAEIIEQIVSGRPIDLTQQGLDIPEKIAHVIQRASERKIASRYANAREMKNEFDEYRLPRHSDGEESIAEHSTVEFLMRRMSNKAGFSTLSGHVSEILEITSDDSVAPAGRLVNILVKDVTLSQRVLTMANSAYYGHGEITALPRAIVLLGLDQVRMCITSALLNDTFEAGSEALRTALTIAFHSAILAKAIAPAFGIKNRADAFTASLYHDLGRFLVIHYFADEFEMIRQRAKEQHSNELTESRAVLGVAYHELGAGVAARWKFASAIIAAMKPMPRGAVTELDEGDDNARLKLLAAYANAVSRAISAHENPDHCALALAELSGKVSAVTNLSAQELSVALSEAAQTTQPYAKLNRLDPASLPEIARLLEFQPLAGAA